MLKDLVRENNEEQARKEGMNAAVGMCKMSGVTPSKEFYTLMKGYISGNKTLDEIDAELDAQYREKISGFANEKQR